jgi:hypothetical protein
MDSKDDLWEAVKLLNAALPSVRLDAERAEEFGHSDAQNMNDLVTRIESFLEVHAS